MEQCKNCQYYMLLERKALCRRYPPASYGKYSFNQPYTYADGWCGEFKEKINARKTPKRTVKKVDTNDIPNNETTTSTCTRNGRKEKDIPKPSVEKKKRGRPKKVS